MPRCCREVRRLLADAEALPRLVQAAAAGLAGRLRLAFVSSIAYGLLPHVAARFRQAHADVALELREATGDVQLAAFDARARSMPASCCTRPASAPAGFARLAGADEPLVLALARGPSGGSATQGGASTALLAEPLVIFPRASRRRCTTRCSASTARAAPTPRIAQEAIQMQTIVNLVSAGWAWPGCRQR